MCKATDLVQALAFVPSTQSVARINSIVTFAQGDYDGRGQQTASLMLTAIMSGGVGISDRELSTQLINSLEQANHSFS